MAAQREGTIVQSCTCKHEFQDQKYGKGMRVMNHAPAKNVQPSRYRCTVCKKEHQSK